MQPFPFGARGVRPVQFIAGPDERARVRHLPGIENIAGGIACAPDAAWAVAAILGRSAPAPQAPINPASLPGYEQYLASGFREKLRPYQKRGVEFLVNRAYAVCADAMRLGKSVTALAASVLVGANRVLIICPETAKPVWRDEIAKWLPASRIATLYGRGADELRVYCHTCKGSGRVQLEGESVRCPDCKAKNGSTYGYQLVAAPASTMKLPPLGSPQDALLSAAVWKHLRGLQFDTTLPEDAVRTWPEWDKLYLIDRKKQAQREAQAAAAAEIQRATHVLCNYDLLVAQVAKSATGKLGVRDDLPGWSSALAAVAFDVAIVDEAHLLRGFSTAVARRGQTRRDQCRATLAGVPRVWALTGTPIFGYVRDLWGLFDTISNGLFGNFFAFTSRYCEGHKSEFGWRADGASGFVNELMERAAWLMIKRSRQDVEADLPPQQYQIVRIEKGKTDGKVLHSTQVALRAALREDKAARGKGIGKALTLLTPLKVPTLVDAVLGELAEGTKVVVFAYLRESAELVAEMLRDALKSKDVAAKMRECNAKLWMAHGEQSADTRHAYAKAFRAHGGAAAFVTTYDSMQVAVSLGGAKTNHCIELHYSPAAILQAKERLNEVGSRGISNVFYVVENSEDERMLDVLLPKMRTLEETLGDKDASLFGKAHSTVTPEESLDDMVARLTAHLADAQL